MPDVAELLGILRTNIDQFIQGCERAFVSSIVQLLNDLQVVNPRAFKTLGCRDTEDLQKLLLLHFNRILRHETTDVTELKSALLAAFRTTVLAMTLTRYLPDLAVRAAALQQFLRACEASPEKFNANEFLTLHGMLEELRNMYDKYRQWVADNGTSSTLEPIVANAHWGAIGARFEQLGAKVGADSGGTKKMTKDTTKIVRKDE